VLDVIHVLEYVWKAGVALHGEGARTFLAMGACRVVESP
jgi:hypothetical protein